MPRRKQLKIFATNLKLYDTLVAELRKIRYLATAISVLWR